MRKTLQEYQDAYSEYYSAGKYETAVEIAKEAVKEYPENFFEINADIATISFAMKDFDGYFEAINNALDRGYCPPKSRREIDPYYLETYKDLLKRWDEKLIELKNNSKPVYDIVLPENYDSSKEYPLFLAFHGWGEDLKMFKEFWISECISKEYILGLIQSSQILGTNCYSWDDNEKAHQEIKEFYSHITTKHKIDTKRVITGGFSQGSTLAIDVALNQEHIPVKGFISLNPEMPEKFEDASITEAKNRGMKGIIITGAKDNDFMAQCQMKQIFDNLGFSCTMRVKENWGHWFPEDLPERIDEGLKIIHE